MSRACSWVAGLVACVAVAAAPGCALTSKGEVQSPRFYSPELAPGGTAIRPSAPGLRLRLGQIEAASYLEERIAYRVTENELGYYDDRRWTEPPEQYLRRALGHELFEQRGLRRVLSGPGAILDVELTAFEEIRARPERARLALSYDLHDERESFAAQSLVLEVPLPPATGTDAERAPRVAAALATALSAAVAKVSDQITSALSQTTPPAAKP
jgi:cholesterol transport system auxiliary component